MSRAQRPAPAPDQTHAPTPAGTTLAVVLGAGQGSRMGNQRNKVLLALGDRPLLVHSLAIFERANSVAEVLLVAHPNELDICRELISTYRLQKVQHVIPGGASRHQSEWQALIFLRERIQSGAIASVLIHDGARPFVTSREIAALVRALRQVDGALLATPLTAGEVVVQADAQQHVERVYPPDQLWCAQTPQAFQAGALLRAYELAARDGFEGTDTATSVERIGGHVRVIAGSARNIKITTPGDLARAEFMLRAQPRSSTR